MHLCRASDVRPLPEIIASGPEELNLQVWHKHVGFQVGGSQLCGALCTPMPSRNGDIDAANTYVMSQVEDQEDFYANILVSPDYPRERVEAHIESNKVVGFKPYHCYAGNGDTGNCGIEEWLPEWVWALADDRGLLILLHIVKDAALADKNNQKYIREHCEEYPNAKLILAHAARGFHVSNTVNGIASLHGLENAWFDTSAVCEAEAIAAILGEFGPRRLLWGSDFPISSQRGRCVSLGTGFVWITTDQVEWNDVAFFGEPVQVGLESINALFNASDQIGLNEDDLLDVFCNNARRLLGNSSLGEFGRY